MYGNTDSYGKRGERSPPKFSCEREGCTKVFADVWGPENFSVPERSDVRDGTFFDCADTNATS